AIGRKPVETGAMWADAWRRINFLGFTGVSIMGISAIDGAMWDLRGKAAGLPIASLIGRSRDRGPAYASGGLWLNQTEAELAAQAESFVEQGFRAVKLRLAGNVGFDLPHPDRSKGDRRRRRPDGRRQPGDECGGRCPARGKDERVRHPLVRGATPRA